MKKPVTLFLRLMLLALALGTGFTSQAQVTYSPVPLTAGSFNADVVANGTAALPPASSTTADVDGGGYYFITQDYYTATTAHSSGLPNSGAISNSISGYSALTYQLASYSANNSLRIAGAGTGTVTFATPTAASEVYVLATSGSGISTVTMTVNYSDGSTTAFSGQLVPDWFTASTSQNVFGMSARANSTTPVSAPNAANTAPFLDQIKLTIPAGKVTTTITGITFNKTSTGGYLQVMGVSVGTYPACTGTPPTATATSTASTACATAGFTLNATGVATSTGLSYQWQSSPTGANTFTSLGAPQATAAYSVASQAASTDYRVVITCANSGLSSTSSIVTVTRAYLSCYCAVVSSGANEYIKSVTFPGTSGFTNATNANSANGTGDFTGTASLSTTLNQGASYVNGVSVTVRSNNTNSQGGMWIDYDHSGTFDASEYIAVGTSSAIATDVTFPVTLVVPSTAQLGQTRVRVRWRNGGFANTDACVTGTTTWYGETEDYLISIAAPANCSAPPATVTATADVASACANSAFNLSTSSIPSTIGGYTYQWQSRTGANAFADIAGATTNPYTIASQTVATDYQLVVSCQYGGTPVTSNVVSVGQNSFDQCYCTTSSTNGCGQYGSITNVAIGTLNNASGCAASTYTVFPATGTATTNLDMGQPATLTLNVAQAGTYSYRYAVWIDYNHNGTFDASEFVASGAPSNSATATATFTIPFASATTLSGATRMRVRTNAGILSYGNFSAGDGCTVTYNGETEDYTVTLVPPAACTGTPPATTASASVTTACPGNAFTLTASGISASIGNISYQWQSSPAGAGTFSSLGAAQTAPTYSVPSQTAATDYRVVVTCTASGLSTTSNVVAVAQTPFLNCYCTPAYTNGGSTDLITSVSVDVMSNSTAAAGNASPYYHDYSSQQTSGSLLIPTLNNGSNAVVSVSFGTDPNQYSAIWIDFNQNGVFGDVANEYVAAGNAGGSGTATLTLAVPANAPAGQTKMRVRGGDDNDTNLTQASACSTANQYGEAEDYLVRVSGPLPVELVSFEAAALSNAVRLAWATASEKSSARFEIERSTDGKAFERIGEVAAQGSTTRHTDYTYLDAQLPAKATTRYYRLRQVDFDGSASYSPVRAVQLGAGTRLELYPNPAHGSLTVSGATAGRAVEVRDALGRLVLAAPAGTDGTARLTLPAGLPAGVYLVRSGSDVRRLTVE